MVKKSKFSEPSLFILISLAEKNRHGYAIMEDIEENYDIKLGPGTLYGAITRLEKSGYISVLESQDRKKPYKLTEEGQIYLTEQIKEIQKVTSLGLKRLGLV
ncbi:PadR family transcriptional regulator [Virgibacillus pantothenticus]|uniref:PadR family transcriptional regulator n=1 Tax=Virgibacillus pantothenticus TaxID=1473 RepID=A0A0L0QL24_VIRPA|nr:PadR family transcriptional regulator [Virgibacillus pantothenticus]KNE19292.1 PadR family transcriptional regulator [Virgibacillus pantothenticus]MED3735699.1 PadR family transcriptional regulator [Virgibacillus pantothenticus]QTY15773.1 PadR family transcriptional regulator [Virgibacillus pantothenticus]SIS96700.1 transcriptional regulator, PadR family [Virgibacillus pantothenticus]